MAGISTTPPKQSQVARPVSSQTEYRMFGEFSGAVGAAYGPQSGSESRISSSILPLNSAIVSLTLVVDLLAEHGVKTTPGNKNPTRRAGGTPPQGRTQTPRDTRVAGAFSVCSPKGYLAFSRISTSRQRLVADIGRVSISETRSPMPAALFSSCALTFLVVRMILPYSGCRMRSSNSTTMVFCILSLTT